MQPVAGTFPCLVTGAVGSTKLLSVLQRGDCLIVSELSRLGRSLGQVVAILDALAKVDVAFVALKENIRVEGKVGADPGFAGVSRRRRGPLDVSTCTRAGWSS